MLAGALAGGFAALAVLLVRPVPLGRPVPVWAWLVVWASAVWCAVVVVPWRLLLPVGVVAGTVAALLAVRRRHRSAARAALTGDRVQEICEVMAAELAAGLPTAGTLRSAARVWEPMSGVAHAHSLGASVPDKLRELSTGPGAGDLRLVAAAWQLAHRSGAGLAEALGGVAEGLRETAATRRTVRSELASARSTARLMAGLPLFTLLMGSGAGGNPFAFLVGSPIGLGCLVVGALLTVLGLWWIESIAASVEGESR